MKRISILLLVIFFSLAGLAQEQESMKDKENTHPVIKFKKITIDLGKIESNGLDTCIFTFKNTGEKPLLITNVMGSCCGGIAPSWPKAPVKPGKTDTIKVFYDTSIDGFFSITFRVNSNAPDSPVPLMIRGRVVSKIKNND